MFLNVLRFVRMPLVLLLIFAIARFALGATNAVPYAPRGNAMFSIVGLTLISCVYYGAMSKKVGGFGWLATILMAVIIMEWAQVLIFIATFVSVKGGFTNSYFIHWDSLNIKEGQVLTLSEIMMKRVGAFVVAPITAIVATVVGRLAFAPLVATPSPAQNEK
jgi:hypothetical protein